MLTVNGCVNCVTWVPLTNILISATAAGLNVPEAVPPPGRTTSSARKLPSGNNTTASSLFASILVTTICTFVPVMTVPLASLNCVPAGTVMVMLPSPTADGNWMVAAAVVDPSVFRSTFSTTSSAPSGTTVGLVNTTVWIPADTLVIATGTVCVL